MMLMGPRLRNTITAIPERWEGQGPGDALVQFLGDEERRLMDLVPALAVRLMKRRVLSRPGVYSLHLRFHSEKVNAQETKT